MTDLVWILAGVIGFTLSCYNNLYLESIVWLALAFYALSNYFERKLKGSKYDY